MVLANKAIALSMPTVRTATVRLLSSFPATESTLLPPFGRLHPLPVSFSDEIGAGTLSKLAGKSGGVPIGGGVNSGVEKRTRRRVSKLSKNFSSSRKSKATIPKKFSGIAHFSPSSYSPARMTGMKLERGIPETNRPDTICCSYPTPPLRATAFRAYAGVQTINT